MDKMISAQVVPRVVGSATINGPSAIPVISTNGDISESQVQAVIREYTLLCGGSGLRDLLNLRKDAYPSLDVVGNRYEDGRFEISVKFNYVTEPKKNLEAMTETLGGRD